MDLFALFNTTFLVYQDTTMSNRNILRQQSKNTESEKLNMVKLYITATV